MEHHRPDTAQSGLNDLKEQIALEYGRCLLQLQQFELMLKAALPTLKVSGFSDELASNVERDRQLLGGKTLGQLVGQWNQRTTLGEEQEIDEDALNGREYICISVGLEDGEWMSEKLKQLVELRNELVHHFLSRFGLNSEASCQEAIDFLATVANIIKDNREALHSFLTTAEKAKNELYEFMNSAEGKHFALSGVLLGQPVENWENTTIVQQLKCEERLIGKDGWVPLHDAIRSIGQRRPGLSPKLYGCSSWREVIHCSQLFEVDKRLSPTGGVTWYRTRRT
ncbi:OST-HTH/LOTUS domain-containing protein [Aeromonas salmonicida]|uniref:OST-HTH/LOTUS domain-containing protein n=1 Tax=Aeromonas salmonicida TaxID=645 RepID=UPI00232F68FF|nr:OST-HTH/LOTUS domain-containing protein [Aeromonas salmonicida]WCH24743.1 OST-HTH/LOTUS domain-containing protein [Aeromonas salmonicida]